MYKPYITISEVAAMMARHGDKRSRVARNKAAHRAIGAIEGAYKSGPKTASWLLPTAEVRAWIAAGCPGPGTFRRAREQAALDAAKRDWHLREDHLADVAGLDR